jgi:hypothetical protein
VASIGGSVHLGSTAVVRGDVVTLGSGLSRDEGSVIEGKVTSSEVGGPFDLTLPGVVVPRVDLRPLSWTFNFGWYFLRAFLLAALAALVVMFWPLRVGRVAQTVVSQPVAAGLLGLLSFVVAIPLLVLLVLSICLSPVALLGGLVLVAAYMFGWIAIGLEVGQRIAAAFRQDWTLAVSAAIGTLALTLVVYGINFIPCIGAVAPVVTYCLGLGAVILTRFGGQEYLGAPRAA